MSGGRERDIAIVGAGLVGSLTAIYLRKHGHRVTLYEKRTDLRKGTTEAGRSINLIVTSRGIQALEQVGLWESVKEITVPVYGRMMHSREGELTYQPYGKDNECNYSVSRSELNGLLMTEAEKIGVDIHFEHSLESLDVEEKRLNFTHRHHLVELSSEHIIGTDGGGSIVRKELMKFFKARGIKSHEKQEFLGSDYKELFMPSKNGLYPIEQKALHIWPRRTHMLMALPNRDGSFTMTLYLPQVGENSFEKIRTQSEVEKLFEKDFKDATDLMPDYKQEYVDNPQGFLGTVRSEPWHYKDHVLLLGDAAHAIVPFFGQGMNCGFEDVYYLEKEIKNARGDYEAAFRNFYCFQKTNADAIADMALENFIEMRDKVADEKFLLKKKLERLLEEKYPQKFRSRYAMVTYGVSPYREVYNKGVQQDEILEAAIQNLEKPDIREIDLEGTIKKIEGVN